MAAEAMQGIVDPKGPAEIQSIMESTKAIKPAENKKLEAISMPRKYRGVTYHRKNNKWVAQASVQGKSKYLGTHPTPERAARVYDAFVISTFGKDVKTNFPVNEVDFSLLPRLRTYKKPHFVDFTMLGLNPMFNQSRKDPNRPKHPKNAYLQFAAEQRRLMKESGRTFVGRGNMHKMFSEQWNILNDHEKEKYVMMANEDRVRYEKEMESYSDPEAYSWMHTSDAFHWLQPQMMPGGQMGEQPGLGMGSQMPSQMGGQIGSLGIPSQIPSQMPSFPESMLPKSNNPASPVVMPPGFMSLLTNNNSKSKPIQLPNPHTPLVIRDNLKVEKCEASDVPAPVL